MNCVVCCKKIDRGDLLQCTGCKAGYHYICLNITSASFMEEQTQLKRNFKCESCLNITHRVRVTDDTPVCTSLMREEGSKQSLKTCSSYETEDLVTRDDSDNMTGLIEKVNRVIIEKFSAFEAKILEEIKNSVTVLTIENSKLRQELEVTNRKCTSYENEISELKTKGQNNIEKNVLNIITKDTTMPISTDTQSLLSTANSANNELGELSRGPPVRPPAQPSQRALESRSYAAVATKPAAVTDSDVVDNYGNINPWTEVKRNIRQNPIKRGGKMLTGPLKAVERKKFLHVWRLEKSTTEDNLKTYIRNVLGDDSEIIVEQLRPKTERNYASFKIGVNESNYDKLCDPEIWPLNIEFCEWIWFRRQIKPKPTE